MSISHDPCRCNPPDADDAAEAARTHLELVAARDRCRALRGSWRRVAEPDAGAAETAVRSPAAEAPTIADGDDRPTLPDPRDEAEERAARRTAARLRRGREGRR